MWAVRPFPCWAWFRPQLFLGAKATYTMLSALSMSWGGPIVVLRTTTCRLRLKLTYVEYACKRKGAKRACNTRVKQAGHVGRARTRKPSWLCFIFLSLSLPFLCAYVLKFWRRWRCTSDLKLRSEREGAPSIKVAARGRHLTESREWIACCCCSSISWLSSTGGGKKKEKMLPERSSSQFSFPLDLLVGRKERPPPWAI